MYRGVHFLQKPFQLHELEVRVYEQYHFLHLVVVVNLVPKFTLEVLEPRLQIIFRLLQLNLVKVPLNLLVLLQTNWHENRLQADCPLPVLEMVQLQGVQFRETELSKDDVLSEESPLEFEVGLTDVVDGVFEALVLGHVIDVVEDVQKVIPILHHDYTGSVHVQHFH